MHYRKKLCLHTKQCFHCRTNYSLIEEHDRSSHISAVDSVVEWSKHRTDDQHGLGSKPTCAILLCSWERHFNRNQTA